MDSFNGRILRNSFPSWTKIYNDDSSVGAVIFSEIGNQIDKVKENFLVNFNSYKDPLKSSTALTKQIYSYDIKDFVYFKEIYENRINFKDAKIFSITNGTEKELTTFDINNFGYQRFFSTFTEEFTMTNVSDFEETNLLLTLDKQTNSDSFDIDIEKSLSFENRITFKTAKHLYIKVSDCDLFYSSNGASRYLDLKQDYFVMLRGYDLLNNPVEEIVFINENQIYKTKNKFLSVCNVYKSSKYNITGGSCFIRHGFNGKVELLNYPINYDVVKIKTKELAKNNLITMDDNYEFQNSNMYIENQYVNSRSQLNYLLKLIENPTVAYNKYDGNIFYSIVSQVVLGLDNDEYIQDIEYNHILQQLMAITNKAKLLTIELGLTPTKNTYLFQNSIEFDIGFESMYQRYSVNETAFVIVKHANVSTLINRILLILEKPNGDISYIGFDNNLNPVILDEPYIHIVESHTEVEKLWRQFRVELNLTTPGQYNFYSISLNPLELKNELINLFDKFEKKQINFDFFYNSVQSYLRSTNNPKGLKINSYSLICEANTPKSIYETNITYSDDPLFGLYIENITNDIFILKIKNNLITNVYKLNQKRDCALLDINNGEFYTHSPIDKYRLEINTLNDKTYKYTRG